MFRFIINTLSKIFTFSHKKQVNIEDIVISDPIITPLPFSNQLSEHKPYFRTTMNEESSLNNLQAVIEQSSETPISILEGFSAELSSTSNSRRNTLDFNNRNEIEELDSLISELDEQIENHVELIRPDVGIQFIDFTKILSSIYLFFPINSKTQTYELKVVDKILVGTFVATCAIQNIDWSSKITKVQKLAAIFSMGGSSEEVAQNCDIVLGKSMLPSGEASMYEHSISV